MLDPFRVPLLRWQGSACPPRGLAGLPTTESQPLFLNPSGVPSPCWSGVIHVGPFQGPFAPVARVSLPATGSGRSAHYRISAFVFEPLRGSLALLVRCYSWWTLSGSLCSGG